MTEQFGGYKLDFSGVTETMEQVFGDKPIEPASMTKRLWEYIKRHGLGTKAA